VFHVKHVSDLLGSLVSLDGRGYKAYKAIEGAYRGPSLDFMVDHVQGDPFAEGTRVRVHVRAGEFPSWALATADRRRACADYLNRALAQEARARSARLGSGKSGEIQVLLPGQQVLARESVRVAQDGGVEARFRVGLPARGRRISGPAARALIQSAIEAARSSLFFQPRASDALRRHVETVEDAVHLRAQLAEHDLVGFVADGAILPRRSGVDDRPMPGSAPVPFESPPSLRRTLLTPNSGPIPGMGIPLGVTLIVGGGYHGKSTLLRALQRGVYDHLPGDGRERVVTLESAVKVRAEDGRSVAGVDISNFIGGLPDGTDTRGFETGNASGSTSQAAAIVEALEAGAEALLLDEDTSATNFMIRDARMQRLIPAHDEPITPFIDRVRSLYEQRGVSSVVVIGGSGDYFDIADVVIAMRKYRPADVTWDARQIALALPTLRSGEQTPWRPLQPRAFEPESVDPSYRHKDVSIRVLATDRVQFGAGVVDLGALEQLVEQAQTRAVAYAVALAVTGGEQTRTVAETLAAIMAKIAADGLGTVHPHHIGELAAFRTLELAGFLNRIRRATPHATRTVAADPAAREERP
jgi:predicted ABC-class ATPase